MLFLVIAGGGALLWKALATERLVPDTLPADPASNSGKGLTPSASGDHEQASRVPAIPGAAGSIRKESLPQKIGPGPKSLAMPDGTFLPVLNGAVGAPAVDWPDGRPYSPVVKKVVDAAGLEWYLHGDGSYTITQNQYRADLGRIEPATTLYNPNNDPSKKPKPILLERAEQDGREKAPGGK